LFGGKHPRGKGNLKSSGKRKGGAGKIKHAREVKGGFNQSPGIDYGGKKG